MLKQLALSGALAISLGGPALAFGGPSHEPSYQIYQVAQAENVEQASPANTTENPVNPEQQNQPNKGADTDDIDNQSTLQFPWMLLTLLTAGGLGIWYFKTRKRDPLAH